MLLCIQDTNRIGHPHRNAGPQTPAIGPPAPGGGAAARAGARSHTKERGGGARVRALSADNAGPRPDKRSRRPQPRDVATVTAQDTTRLGLKSSNQRAAQAAAQEALTKPATGGVLSPEQQKKANKKAKKQAKKEEKRANRANRAAAATAAAEIGRAHV